MHRFFTQINVNISGRCYIPNNYFTGNELTHLVVDRKPHNIPNAQLKQLAIKMLDIADNLTNEAIGAINLLPSECQRAVLSALDIYQGIGKLIRSNPQYLRRTVLPKMERIRIALRCMYFTSIPSLYERNTKKG